MVTEKDWSVPLQVVIGRTAVLLLSSPADTTRTGDPAADPQL